MYQCVCDGCGKTHVNDEFGYIAWADECQAFDDAAKDGWTEIDGKHYCHDCYEYDEETDEYIPKKK